MRTLNAPEPPFPGDDGAADPAVAAALAAYAAGRGSEHAALTALAGSRLLVPVVALLTEEDTGAVPGHGGGAPEQDAGGAPGRPPAGLRREKTADMALPTLIGRDGRAAVLAFTCLDALARWRPDARPVPVPAARAWLAGTQDASAVVIDVAGPVPLAVDGARLAALAAGRPAPLPHQDPDVLAALQAALAAEPLITQVSLTTPGQPAAGPAEPDPAWSLSGEDAAWLGGPAPAAPDAPEAAGSGPGGDADRTDLALRVTLADGCDPAAASAAVHRVADTLLAGTGGRLRRGIAVSVEPPRPPGGRG